MYLGGYKPHIAVRCFAVGQISISYAMDRIRMDSLLTFSNLRVLTNRKTWYFAYFSVHYKLACRGVLENICPALISDIRADYRATHGDYNVYHTALMTF